MELQIKLAELSAQISRENEMLRAVVDTGKLIINTLLILTGGSTIALWSAFSNSYIVGGVSNEMLKAVYSGMIIMAYSAGACSLAAVTSYITNNLQLANIKLVSKDREAGGNESNISKWTNRTEKWSNIFIIVTVTLVTASYLGFLVLYTLFLKR